MAKRARRKPAKTSRPKTTRKLKATAKRKPAAKRKPVRAKAKASSKRKATSRKSAPKRAADPMKTAIDVVRKVEAAWERNDLDALDQYFAPGFRSEAEVPMLPPGLEGAKIAHQATMQAFPDRRTKVLDVFSDGAKVCVRVKMTGTNKGGVFWYGAEPNDAKIDVTSISVYEVKNGKITGHYALNDGQSMLEQLGVWTMPPMPDPT